MIYNNSQIIMKRQVKKLCCFLQASAIFVLFDRTLDCLIYIFESNYDDDIEDIVDYSKHNR